MLVPEHVGEGGEVVGQVGAVGRLNGDTLADDWFWHWGLSIKTNEQHLLVIIMITIFNHLVVTDLVEHHQTSSRHLENWSFEMFFKMKLVRD